MECPLQAKTCLVTGCAGFVGSHLTAAPLGRGHGAFGVDDLSTGRPEALGESVGHARFPFERADVKEPGLLARRHRVRPFEAVVPLVAIVSVPSSIEHPEPTMATNHEASVRLHAEARALGIDAFVFAGSAAEYGDAVAACGGGPPHPLSPYGLSKLRVSQWIEASRTGVSLRFFNISGERQNFDNPYAGVITHLVRMALCGDPLVVHGDGLQTRDFIHIDDVIEAVVRASGLEGPAVHGIYDVGTGTAITINALAEMIIKETGATAAIVHAPRRPGDILDSCADVAPFAATTGFQPRVGLREGLRKTLGWYAKNIPAPKTTPE